MEAELATKIVSSLREAGIDFVSYVPESRLSQILPLMRQDARFKLAPSASEADATRPSGAPDDSRMVYYLQTKRSCPLSQLLKFP